MRLFEGDGDAAGLQQDAFRQAVQFLRHDLDWCFHQQLGSLQPLVPPFGHCLGHPAPAQAFVIAFVAIGQAPQMRDEHIPVGQPVGPDRSIIQGAMICWARRRPTPSRNSTTTRASPKAPAAWERNAAAAESRGGEPSQASFAPAGRRRQRSPG